MNKKDVFLQYFQLGFVTNCNFFSCFNATPSVIRGICVLCNLLDRIVV